MNVAPESTSEFSFGDIVECVEKENFDGLELGAKYQVFDVSGNGSIKVENKNSSPDKWFNPDNFILVKARIRPELPSGIKGKTDLNDKPHLAFLDPHLILEMGIGMRFGAKKHGFNNHWTLKADASQEVLDSIMRHLFQYLSGKELDEEQNISNLACIVNNLNFLYRLNRIHGYDSVINTIYGETR